MATEARPSFLAITGPVHMEALEATLRFAAAVREASGEPDGHPAVTSCAQLAARAFGGDGTAWAPLVRAVSDLLGLPPGRGGEASRSRRELRSFVAENADLLEA